MPCNFSRIRGPKPLWFWVYLLGFADGKKYSWCQTYDESCVGKRHEFQESEYEYPYSVKGAGKTMRFADWDGDGDMDVLSGDYNKSGAFFLVTWHERLSDSTFHLHELLQLPVEEATESSLEVVDWDGDGNLDLLVCGSLDDQLTVSFMNGLFSQPSMEILSVNGSKCEMQAVDFDEDGDQDLVIGNRYFERISTEVFERRGDENPLAIFDHVLSISDMDGDGRLEVLAKGWVEQGWYHSLMRLRYFRRTADGTFVEPTENPFADVTISEEEEYTSSLFVADWDGNGLPDLLIVHVFWGPKWSLKKFYKHVLNTDMAHNSHINPYEVIPVQYLMPITVVDWNGDGFADVVVGPAMKNAEVRFFEFQDGNFHDVPGVFDIITATINSIENGSPYRKSKLAIVDWDQDGDLDAMISARKIHYFENKNGVLQAATKNHPLSSIELEASSNPQLLPVDWDNDGDMDLVLGPGDGRIFEQLSDGTLREWPLDQNPFKKVLLGLWRFVDCDADGDLDLLRVMKFQDPPMQACENDGRTLRCDPDYLCLGTNLSNFRKEGGPLEGFGWLSGLDLGNLSDGLEFIVSHSTKETAKLWKAGFCVPRDPCYKKGVCLPKHLNCSCFTVGHELGDCSGCEAHFHSVPPGKVGELHGCKACPGDGSPYYGRGICFDDESAKTAPQEATALLIARGNGSCSCNEGHFYGSDEEGRSTCAEGSCPAGTEEKDGHCDPCDAGSFSVEGGNCKICLPGTFSLAGSSNCSTCPPGSISPLPGASVCGACPVGKYEANHQFCYECPAGFVSAGNSCAKCQPGFHAPKPASAACEQCPAATFSREEASTRCSPCPSGQISAAGSAACNECDAGRYASSGACVQCPAGTFSTNASTRCSPCSSGHISAAGSAVCIKCVAGRFSTEGFTCEACPGGTFALAGSSACKSCPVGHVSSPNSAACSSCENLLVRASPDGMKQTCQIVGMDVVLAVISWMTSACFTFFCLIGLCGRIPMADISEQGQKHVVTSSLPHFVLKWKWASPSVIFRGTGVPVLDDGSLPWKVKALSFYQLTLSHDHDLNMPLDTSMGHLQIKFPQAFLFTGIWHCPLMCCCLLLGASTAAAASQLTMSLTLVTCGSGMCAGLLLYALWHRQSQRTPLAKRRWQFLKEWSLMVERCSRGPERSLTVGKLHDFLQFFDTFIKERSMYYVCSNIVKPLTEPFKLSFSELVGPTQIQWFVSHYWGMPIRHFGHAIRKHAQSQEDWRESSYWICTFSNSQWHVKLELGSGRWQDSSFYLALRSPSCKGTTMVIDELVLPLQRIWCLFEVYQTICLSQTSHFQGLLLCTSNGVLQEGQAGTDVAVAVAKTVTDLDIRGAQASSEEDRLMIHALIEQMDGGFETMNTFVRDTIYKALEASHLHYENIFKDVVRDLTSNTSAPTSQALPLPTLLTSRAAATERKDQDDTD